MNQILALTNPYVFDMLLYKEIKQNESYSLSSGKTILSLNCKYV